MSTPQPARPAKLVIGLFMVQQHLFDRLAERLQNDYGPADQISPWYNFNFTSYYQAEMGGPLYRRLMAFNALIDQSALAAIKLHTNSIERDYAPDQRRQVNIDPGYLLLERFVLATGKNFSHRIYIGKGIYADLTLIYQKGGFQVLPWTYPDYAQDNLQQFLLQVRERYRQDLAIAGEK